MEMPIHDFKNPKNQFQYFRNFKNLDLQRYAKKQLYDVIYVQIFAVNGSSQAFFFLLTKQNVQKLKALFTFLFNYKLTNYRSGPYLAGVVRFNFRLYAFNLKQKNVIYHAF